MRSLNFVVVIAVQGKDFFVETHLPRHPKASVSYFSQQLNQSLCDARNDQSLIHVLMISNLTHYPTFDFPNSVYECSTIWELSVEFLM